MHSRRCIFFSPFLGFVYTDHCWTLIWEDAKQWRKQTLYRENHSPFTHNTVKTYKNYSSVSAIMFLYIYIYWLFFNVSFDFFCSSFYCSSFQSHGSSTLCLSAVSLGGPLLLQSWCSRMCLRVSVPPFTSWISPPCPSLSPKRALFLPQCDSISLLLSAPFSTYHISKSVIYHVANFVFHPLPKHSWHSLRLHCTEAVPTQQFYMQQSNATQTRLSTPSCGCLPQFTFK